MKKLPVNLKTSFSTLFFCSGAGRRNHAAGHDVAEFPNEAYVADDTNQVRIVIKLIQDEREFLFQYLSFSTIMPIFLGFQKELWCVNCLDAKLGVLMVNMLSIMGLPKFYILLVLTNRFLPKFRTGFVYSFYLDPYKHGIF